MISWNEGEATVTDVRKKNRIRHIVEGDLPEVGDLVNGNIDWSRRYSHMRMHTSQHLVSAVVNEVYGSDTVGNQIGQEKSELTSNLSKDINQSELNEIEDKVNDYISKDLRITISEEHVTI